MTTPVTPTQKSWFPVIPSRYIKALGALVTAGLGAFLTANADGHVTSNEWVWVGLMALATTGVVAVVPNKP